MKILLALLFVSSPAAYAAGKCGGKEMPQICDGGCLENYVCKSGKWVKSNERICHLCGEDSKKDAEEPEESEVESNGH